MKEIIEKIEALRIKFNPEDAGSVSALIRTTNNITINKAIAIFNAEFEPKDQPDCEGWWWYVYEGQTFGCWYIKQKKYNGEDVFYMDTKDCETMAVCHFVGKWIKAIVPE